jgi:GrpB-like predicted nucleotidyltransferase (UPF0157 family)
MRRDGGPIEPYCRVPIVVHEADPRAPEVARRVIELIAARRPGAVAEHVGSSAVPGLAGKGTIDLLLPTPPDQIPAVTRDLLALGFQPQAIATAFPPSRPMLQGVIRHDGTSFRVHVQRAIVAAGTVDSIAFTSAKHDFIVGILERLGLAGDAVRPPPA